MPLCVVISFIYSVAILVQSIVYEKEQRLKEVMKMMGLSNAVHWTAWFITSIVSMLTIVILLTIVLKVRLFCFCFYESPTEITLELLPSSSDDLEVRHNNIRRKAFLFFKKGN